MINIDSVINSLSTMSASKRAIWATNAANVIARGPFRNPAYTNAMRLRNAIVTFEATRPMQNELIASCGLDWDRTIKGRTTFRGFDGDRLIARVTRIKPSKFVVHVLGTSLSQTFTTLSSARAAAAEALHAGADGAPADLPLAA